MKIDKSFNLISTKSIEFQSENFIKDHAYFQLFQNIVTHQYIYITNTFFRNCVVFGNYKYLEWYCCQRSWCTIRQYQIQITMDIKKRKYWWFGGGTWRWHVPDNRLMTSLRPSSSFHEELTTVVVATWALVPVKAIYSVIFIYYSTYFTLSLSLFVLELHIIYINFFKWKM